MKTVQLYECQPPHGNKFLAAVVEDDNLNLYTYSNRDGAWEKETMLHHADLAMPWYDFNEWDIYPIDNGRKPPEAETLEKMLLEVDKGDLPGHPFRGNQHTGGIGGDAPVADPDAGGLKQYLMMVSSHIEKGDGFASYILKHGKSYAFDDSSFVGGEAHMCFKNSTMAMMTNPDLTYVEGYVSVHGVPIHHAWNVDSSGKVIDNTIKDSTGKLGYYGVPFKSQAVFKTISETKHYGMLTDFSASRTVGGDPEQLVET